MSTLYNENNPYCAQALRNLIASGIIPVGDVAECNIADLSPDDVRGYNNVHFFAGIGGWAYARILARWPADRQLWSGSCPCFPAGTFVMARRGFLPIEEIAVGDEVLTHRARWRRVTATGSEKMHETTVPSNG